MAPRSKTVKPKRVKRVHDPDTVKKAIESIKTKRYSLRKAAQAFDIPVSTLCEKMSGKMPLEPVHFTLLTAEEELKLKKYVLDMASCGFGLTTEEVRYTAMAIVDLRRPPPAADPEHNLPSSSWVYRYFSRHQELTLRTPQSLGKERALVTPTSITHWFETLKQYIDRIDPEMLTDGTRLYNADESGFGFDPRARRVVAFQGAKHVYKLTANNKTQVTVLACMSAAGHFINPLIVYPYKRLPSSDLTRDFPGAKYNFSDNGWITAAIFFTWLRDVFIPATSTVKKPLLLLVDGHASHTTLTETSLLCEEHGIILYCFIAHASHLIQPLDQAFFGTVKPAWSKATKQHLATTGDAVNLESFASVLRPVWDTCCTRDIAAKSFRCAGLLPFNPGRVVASGKFGPSAVFRPQPVVPALVQEPPRDTSFLVPPQDTPRPTSISVEMPPQDTPCLNEPITDEMPPQDFPCINEPITVEMPPQDTLTSLSLNTPISVEMPPLTLEAPPQLSASFPPGECNSTCLPSQGSTDAPSAEAGPSSISTPIESQDIMNFQQLSAFKGLMDFLFEDVTKKEYQMFFSVLAGTQEKPQDGKYVKFVELLQAFKNTNFSNVPIPVQAAPKKTCLTVDDILQLPRFSANKGKRTKKTTPTIPHCISSEDFRKAMKKKNDAKDLEERTKLARKAEREANKKKKDAEKEMAKKKREEMKEATLRKKKEMERQKKEKKELEKILREREECSDSEEEDGQLRKDMEREMEAADDDVEDGRCLNPNLSTCMGCKEKGEEEEI